MKNAIISENELKEYFSYTHDWIGKLPALSMQTDAVSPSQIAIMVVDMTNGFCNEGPLASARINKIIQPIVTLINDAWNYGVRSIFLVNDSHKVDAVEFQSYPPHCIEGTIESQPVDEIKSLSFYDNFSIISKNSLQADLKKVLKKLPNTGIKLTHFVIVGNCIDLCVYQAAMALRLDANESQDKTTQVILPVNCVETYDMDIKNALTINAEPHPGDIISAMFLHHMALNGIQIVNGIQF